MEAPVQLSTDILTSVKIKVPFQTVKKNKKQQQHTQAGVLKQVGNKLSMTVGARFKTSGLTPKEISQPHLNSFTYRSLKATVAQKANLISNATERVKTIL